VIVVASKSVDIWESGSKGTLSPVFSSGLIRHTPSSLYSVILLPSNFLIMVFTLAVTDVEEVASPRARNV
jgi:hypothetical protein